MKKLALTLMLIAACVGSVGAQGSLVTAATSLRATAVLTNSDVYTTATLPASCKAVDVYIAFTKGSATNGVFSLVGAIDDNPASTGYYRVINPHTNEETSITLTASGNYVMRVPRENFGAYRYWGVVTVGTGTMTSSDAIIKYKVEY